MTVSQSLSKLFTLVLFTALGLASVRASEIPAVGVYQSEVGIYVLTISLLPNGDYMARWDADIGSNGVASGTWTSNGDEVHLSPKKEEGQPMTGYLRVLVVRNVNGRRALIRKEDAANDKNPFFYLYLRTDPEARLEEATYFAFGGVGYAGITSPGEAAFREIMKLDNARARLRGVFESATPEGKCYALVGLKKIAPADFKWCAGEFRKEHSAKVRVMSGCIESVRTAEELLAAIDKGSY
jgi:hypothetical protein